MDPGADGRMNMVQEGKKKGIRSKGGRHLEKGRWK
jgi:hypothetical protein